MTQTPAGWYADPDDQAQFRYWDGASWTDDRSPRVAEGGATGAPGTPAPGSLAPGAPAAGSSTAEPAPTVAATVDGIADGIAGALTSLGTWAKQQATPAAPGQPTFASVAASCRDQPPRQPLSVFVELTPEQVDLVGVGSLCAAAGLAITDEGVQLTDELCRLVPNPWDPQDPAGVAVFVGAHQLGRLPADVAAGYSPVLTALTQRRLLATGTATISAQGNGVATSGRVVMSLPEVAQLGG